MSTDWSSDVRSPDPELLDPALDDRLSVLRNFTVADHLDDRSKEALAELARHVI